MSVTRLGPLRLVTFVGGRGLVTYRDLGGAAVDAIRRLVAEGLGHFRADPGISRVEWKARGHDSAVGLHEALLESGFIPGEEESIMVGEARLLLVEVPLPQGVVLGQVTEQTDVRAMQDETLGEPASEERVQAVLHRLSMRDGMKLWLARAQGQVVGAGRLEPVPDSDFAGLWGGATRERWRGRGIYRALTAARARSAISVGKTYVNSDSTEYSRPILERAGLVKVSTTTPYHWQRRA